MCVCVCIYILKLIYIATPFFFVYFLWWARNCAIFQNTFIPFEVVAGLVIKLVGEHKPAQKVKKPRIPVMPSILDGVSWSFFDRACQGHPSKCSAGAKLYITKSHF
jgi:hypothetical protein